jgi:hypothetical protein
MTNPLKAKADAIWYQEQSARDYELARIAMDRSFTTAKVMQKEGAWQSANARDRLFALLDATN